MGPAGDAANLAPDWRTSIPRGLAALVGAWRKPEAWSGITRLGGQDMPAEAAGVVTLGELVVHGWDLARATGQAFNPDPGTLVPLYDLTVKTFGSGDDAARGPAFAPAVPVPGDAPMMDQIRGPAGARSRLEDPDLNTTGSSPQPTLARSPCETGIRESRSS